MIDARDLRAGNWVINDEGEECQVMEISFTENPTPKMYPHQEFGLRHPMMQNFLNIVQECEPIPLSPEVLEKCGFTVDRYSANLYRCPIGYWQVYVDDSAIIFRVPGSSLANIKHLHQLQNLYYALTGTELNYRP